MDPKFVKLAKVGASWRTFCPECGDGAGWRLDKIEWDPLAQFDELHVDMKIQFLTDKHVDIPIGDGHTKPYWNHDCQECIYLGSRQVIDNKFDFYYCEPSGSDDYPYVGIIRGGNEPDNYDSHAFKSIEEPTDINENDAYDILSNLIAEYIHQQIQ
jgi:hypothetical protein